MLLPPILGKYTHGNIRLADGREKFILGRKPL